MDCEDPYNGTPYCAYNLCAIKFGIGNPHDDPCAPNGKCVTNGDPDPNNAYCECQPAYFGELCQINANPWCRGPEPTDPVCSGRGTCTLLYTDEPTTIPTAGETAPFTARNTLTDPETLGPTVTKQATTQVTDGITVPETEVLTPTPTFTVESAPYGCVCNPGEGFGQWCENQPCEGGTVNDCGFGECVADVCVCPAPGPTSTWTNNATDNNRCTATLCVDGQGYPTDPDSATTTCTCLDGFFGDFCQNVNCPFDTRNPPVKCGDEGPGACNGLTGQCECSVQYVLQPDPLKPQVCIDRCNRQNGNVYGGPPPADCFCQSNPGTLDPRTTRPDLPEQGCYLTYCVPGNGLWNGPNQRCDCDASWAIPDDWPPGEETYYRCNVGRCSDPDFPVWQPLPPPGFCIDPSADPVDTWPCAGRGIVTSAPGDPITCDCFQPYTDESNCKDHACQYDTTPEEWNPPIVQDGVCDCSTADLGLDGVFCEILLCEPGQGQWDEDSMTCNCYNEWTGPTCAINGCYPPIGSYDAMDGVCRCTANPEVYWEPGPISNVPDTCLEVCPPNSYWDDDVGGCICEPFYFYEPLSGGLCDLFCVNGSPITDECVCDEGWSTRENGCVDFDCGPNGVHDPRDPTDNRCVCDQFWNGPLCDVYCFPENEWQYSDFTGKCECILPTPPGCSGGQPTPPPVTNIPTQGPPATPSPSDDDDDDNLALILGLSLGIGIPVLLVLILVPLFYAPSSPLYVKRNQTTPVPATTPAPATAARHRNYYNYGNDAGDGRYRNTRRRIIRNSPMDDEYDDDSYNRGYGSTGSVGSDGPVFYQ